MATTAQVLANQKNAHASTGARTPEGKHASSQNSTTHALSGAFRVLPQENQQAFDESLASFKAEFKPRGEHETFLVERMAQARWELKRINRLLVEVAQRMTRDAADTAPTADAAIAEALLNRTANAYVSLKRYEAAAERSYLRCHRELMQNRDRQAEETADDVFARAMSGDLAFMRTAPAVPSQPAVNPERAGRGGESQIEPKSRDSRPPSVPSASSGTAMRSLKSLFQVRRQA